MGSAQDESVSGVIGAALVLRSNVGSVQYAGDTNPAYGTLPTVSLKHPELESLLPFAGRNFSLGAGLPIDEHKRRLVFRHFMQLRRLLIAEGDSGRGLNRRPNLQPNPGEHLSLPSQGWDT